MEPEKGSESHDVSRRESQHQSHLDSGIVPWATSNHVQSLWEKALHQWSRPAIFVPLFSSLSRTKRSIQSIGISQQMQELRLPPSPAFCTHEVGCSPHHLVPSSSTQQHQKDRYGVSEQSNSKSNSKRTGRTRNRTRDLAHTQRVY
jgi:hypothetical protein